MTEWDFGETKKSEDVTVVKPAATASEGAASVAEAVKRVADAAVAEVNKVKTDEPVGDFTFTGTLGGRFTASAPTARFSTGGTVKLNGAQLHTFGWSALQIEGSLPADAKPGEVVVEIDDETKFTGYFKG